MMLLNIVKQRYLDVPVYLDIDSVISSYSLATTGNIGLTVDHVAYCRRVRAGG
jgi:hypothetical protein